MANLTRILNNQITNSTIIASQKIAAGTITGSLFSSNVTVPGDLLISGNLFVLGTSAYTTIASTNTYVNDPLVVLNNGFAGTNIYDEGVVFNRGSLLNQAFIWSEFNKEFRLVGTTETGTTYGNVAVSNFANLHIGNITVDYTAVIGTLSLTNLNVSGNILASSVLSTLVQASNGTFGNVSAGIIGNVGTAYSGASINLSGNVLATAGVFNELTVNGNETVTGYLNVTGNVLGATASFAAINSTGLINTTGNISGAVINAGAVNSTGLINTTANISAAIINTGELNSTGLINTTGNVSAATVIAGQFNTTGNLVASQVSTGTLNATGLINTTANISAAVINTGALNSTGLINTTGNVSAATVIAGQFNTTGNLVASQVSTGTLNATGLINTAGNVSAATVIAGQFNTTGNVLATGAVLNALTVNGTGAFTTLTATGNAIVGLFQAAAINETPIGNATPSTGVFTTATAGAVNSPFIGNTGAVFTGASLNVSGNVLAAGGIYNALTVNGTGAFTTLNTTTLTATGNVIGGQAQFASINSTPIGNAVASTGAFTSLTATSVNSSGNVLGAVATFSSLQTNGNATVTGYLNVAGNILGSAGTLSTLVLNDTANATEATGSSGALQIKGGASIAKDVHIGGNLYVSNIFATSYNVLTVNDPLLYLTAANTYPYNYEIGFYSQFVGGAGNIYQHSGVVRDHVDAYWKFFSNSVAEPTSTITFDVNTKYDGIKAGNLILTDSTAAISTGTGALVVGGGAGIGGTVVAAQLNSTGNVLGQAGTFNALTVNGLITTAGINSSANILATGAVLNALTVNGTGTFTTLNATTLTATGNVIGGLGQFAAINATPIGNASASTGAFTTLTATSLATTGNVIGGLGQFAAINATPIGNTTPSTGVFTTVTAGEVNAPFIGNTGAVFIGASLNVSGNVLASSAIFNTATANGNLTLGAALIAGGTGGTSGQYLQSTGTGLQWVSISTGSSIVSGGSNVTVTANYVNVAVNGTNVASFSTQGLINTAIGAAGPSTGTFTTATAGQINSGFIGNTGTAFTGASLNVSGNVLGSAATFSSSQINGNETVTGYLNVAGNVLATRVDATTIGATGVIYANVTSDVTSTTTGAIRVPNGGINLAGNILTSKSIYVGTAALTEVNDGLFKNVTILASNSGSDYTQLGVKNTNGNGSADLTAYGDIGSDSGGWADMGFAGSTFNDPYYTITKPQDGYFFVNANSAAYGGNLVLATSQIGNFNDIVFGVGSFQATSEVARFHGNVGTTGNLRLKYTTTSTGTTSGALQVSGGVGIGANLWVGGGTIINSGRTTDTFQVLSSTSGNVAIYANLAAGAGTSETVIVGGANLVPQAGVTLKVSSPTSMMLPVGPTAARPSSIFGVGYDVAGMIRFNSTINNMEFYDGATWQTAGSAFTIISDRQFSGNVGGGFGNVDGTNTTFTLQANATTASTIISINGVMQFPTLAYSVSGDQLEFTEPPAPGDVIDARILTTTTTVSSITSGNGLNQFTVDGNYANIQTGLSVSTPRITVNNDGNIIIPNGSPIVYNQSNIAAQGTNIKLLDSFSTSAYGTAKYLFQIRDGANIESGEVLLAQDGVNVSITTYAVLAPGGVLGTFQSNISSGTVRWFYVPGISTYANIKIQTTYIV